MPHNIEAATSEELFKQDTDGCIPLLVDITDDNIIWNSPDSLDENGHLRLVYGNIPMIYEGKKYRPANFSFEPPSEDGVKVGSASVTISAIDQRVTEIIETIESSPHLTVIAAYSKMGDEEFVFSKLYHYEFTMGSVQWDGITAKWNLTYDSAMEQNCPVDMATEARCPAAYDQNS